MTQVSAGTDSLCDQALLRLPRTLENVVFSKKGTSMLLSVTAWTPHAEGTTETNVSDALVSRGSLLSDNSQLKS